MEGPLIVTKVPLTHPTTPGKEPGCRKDSCVATSFLVVLEEGDPLGTEVAHDGRGHGADTCTDGGLVDCEVPVADHLPPGSF